jgi:membrane-associated phospholipid phosphatase
MRRLVSSVLCCALTCSTVWAQETQSITTSGADSNRQSLVFVNKPANQNEALNFSGVTPGRSSAITPKSFIMPAALLGAGALSFFSSDARKVNDVAKSTMWAPGTERKMYIDNYTIGIPVVAVYGLNLAGVKGKNNLLDRTLLLGMSSVVCNAVVFSTKRLTHEQRPDGSDYFSFPSGHTAEAFVAAEFMRQEYKDVSPWYGVAGYAAAVGTGMLRMYHDKHWFNDVLTGAGVGILSTRFSYWLYPKIKDKFFGKKANIPMVAPIVNTNGSVGVSLSYNF